MTGHSAPRAEYARRMHRVLAHIDTHLDEPLELADLAAVAHFSPFHFHRLFTAWMGETMGDYLRRRRLEVGAQRLLAQPRTPVLAIALAVGFGSGEAFARAFKLHFDDSPSQWRRAQQHKRKFNQVDGNPGQVRPGLGGDDGLAFQPFEDQPMLTNQLSVQVIQRPPRRVAYMRYVGPMGDPVLQFWQHRFQPFMASHGLLKHPRYGISHDDPQITAPEKCRYDTAVEVDDDFVAGGDVHITTLPGGTYASMPYQGTADNINAAWTALMRDWLPQSGWQFDNRAAFEHYAPDAAYNPATGEFACDIMVPLTRL